jgi:hypothetical protein
MSKHPATKMTKAREDAWLKFADDQDFFDMITLLSRLYHKKKYSSGERGYKTLLEAYPDHVKTVALSNLYKNNVPFKSSGDAPGSIAIEEAEKSIQEQTLDELMDLI